MEPNHWVATVSLKSPFKRNLITGQDDNLWPGHLMTYVDANQDGIDRREIMWEWGRISSGDAIWLYAADPYQTICGMARIVQVNASDAPRSVELIWDVGACQALAEGPIPWSGRPHPRRPGLELKEPMLTTALRWLEERHLGVAAWHESGDDDLAENDARTRAIAWTVLRPGQQAFRQLLRSHYGSCVITGETVTEVLDAAHITPFSGTHSDLLENGLLLRTDLHRLFDRYLFSIDGKQLVISPQLKGTSYEDLPSRSLHDKVASSASSNRVRYHLDRFLTRFPS
jgi:hypothetical protein